jgi:hypothetical protein
MLRTDKKLIKKNLNNNFLLQLPKFMVIGAAKCGTTSLCDNLNQHPQLAQSSPKEPQFFSSTRYFRGLDWYLNLWKDIPKDKLRFEGTTLYVFAECQERIQSLIPDIKLIMMVRDPVKRAWSHYWPQYRVPPYSWPISVLQRTNSSVVRRGIYIEQIKKWHEYFPKENFLVIRSEDYFADEAKILKEVHRFLGVEEIVPEKILKTDPWEKKKEVTGYPPIPENIKEWLTNFYKPYNEELESYLGRKFNW